MTSTAERWYAENLMVSEPPVPCDFKVGDLAKLICVDGDYSRFWSSING